MGSKRNNFFPPSFPRRRESIFHATKMDSRLRGNDEKRCRNDEKRCRNDEKRCRNDERALGAATSSSSPSPQPPAPSPAAEGGFTLPELIIVIVLLGILAVGGVNIITGSINAYNDQSTRAELVNTADNALRQMAGDVRAALPNSVRLNGTTALQVINTVAGARYRDDPGTAPGGGVNTPQSRLQFNKADDSFNLLGQFSTSVTGTESLVIYNTGQAGANAYAGDAVIYSGGFAVTPNSGEDQLTLNPPHQFPFRSPGQRIYAVNNATTYYCNGGRLMRVNSAITAPMPTTGGAPVTGNVTNCQFTYNPGTATRAGLVTLRLTLTRNGESVTLMHQVHVVNVP